MPFLCILLRKLRQPRSHVAAMFLWTSSLGMAGQGLDHSKAITQYVSQTWSSDDGLPQDSVRAIIQTGDGYLWLGTVEGLARFDGVRFEVFDTSNTPGLANSAINSLCEAPNGDLWAGTAGGLIRYRQGDFLTYTTKDGLASDVVFDLSCPPDGSIWIATDGGGICRLSQGRFEVFDQSHGLSSPYVNAIEIDQFDRVWAGTWGGGLALLDQGRFEIWDRTQGLLDDVAQAVLTGTDGSLWVGTRRGLYRLRKGILERVPLNAGGQLEIINTLYQDLQGALWIGTRGGLLRYREEGIEVFDSTQGLCSDNVTSIYEDREGSLWIGTNDGLHRLRDGSVSVYSSSEGLSHDLVWSVVQGRDDSIWVATGGGGVNRMHDGVWTSYEVSDDPAQDFVWTLLIDRRGRLLAGTGGNGIYRFEKGRFVPWLPDQLGYEQAWTMLQDRSGAIWLGTVSNGLKRIRKGEVESFTTETGLPSNQIWALHEDSQGRLWVGTGDAGLCLFEDGHCRNFGLEEGLRSKQIVFLREDSRGALWIGTHGGGLSWIEGDRLRTLSARDGLFSDVIYSILEDGQGALWMSSTKGIFQVARSDFDEFAAGLADSLRYRRYGKAQGLKGYTYAGSQPSACRSRDGRLWFVTQKGLAVVNPGQIRQPPAPRTILIEEVLVDGQPLPDAVDPLRLPSDAERLEIRYNAPILRDSEQVRFRHRLLGFDSDWVDAGTRRSAFYSRLPAGEYVFEAAAAIGQGAWSPRAASLALTRPPKIFETQFFIALCVAAALTAVWAGVRWRVRGLQRRNRLLSQEIYERRRAEEALQRSERRFRGYFEMPLVGFALTSPQGRFLKVNERLCSMLGYSTGELLEMRWQDLGWKPDGERLKRDFEKCLQGRGGSSEVRMKRKDDSKIYVKSSLACVTGEGGAVDHCVHVVQDLSDSKRMEQQLRDSRKMEAVGRLAGGVAHDFNNMLTVISGYGQLLRNSLTEKEELGSHASAILDATHKAESLTRQLLAFSRRQILAPRILDLNQVIEGMISLLQPMIGEDIHLITRLSSDLRTVKIDAGQFQQVLMNLAANARDAMPDGGNLVIATGNLRMDGSSTEVPAGDWVLVSVRDCGSGMEAEVREHVFEPFYTTKATGKGTGLGLATVYGIIKQSEGHILCSSKVGEGTEFRIFLPPAMGRVERREESTQAQSRSLGGRETILVVEDDEGIRGLIGTALRQNGYRILCAESGPAALELAEEHRQEIDLLLTDVVMPGMNGKELARRLTSRIPELPVIFMSGYNEEAIDRHGVLEPGTHFVQKPFTPSALTSTIREILDAPVN